jgi:hypothetical protein
MEEIVIDDKKYLSSKRAAKVTGYAKDYIGQLCREGRVPARLVGRSWYVLESALKDHRFGGKGEEKEEEQRNEVYSRYEADELEVVEVSSAPAQEVKAEEAPEDAEEERGETKSPTHTIQEAWEAWFDRVAHTAAVPAPEESEGLKEEEEVSNMEAKEEGESVAIHAFKATREDRVTVERLHKTSGPSLAHTHVHKTRKKTPKVLLGLFIVATAGLVAINTGYFDSYIISRGQDSFFSGINIYKK